MKIVGLITEYNPFHNGHQYHIEQAKEVAGADAIIVIMSGDYVQRGTPAVMPMQLRCECALLGGADLVLMLPVRFATASAEQFAHGSVSLLNSLGCVDSICFGSECGDIKMLMKVADILSNEPEDYKKELKAALKDGCAFPVARSRALSSCSRNENLDGILDKPNNILAVEYLKALLRLNSKIQPYTIQRIDAGYHDTMLAEQYSSASALRQSLDTRADILSWKKQMPQKAWEYLSPLLHQRFPVDADDFSLLLKQKLLQETVDSLLIYEDVSKELANRIINNRDKFLTFTSFCSQLKTKELTYSRISRALLHILLGIKKQEGTDSPSYARVLGFTKAGEGIMREIKKSSSIPLVTKLSKANCDMQEDLYAVSLYESVVTDKYKTPFYNEFEHPIIRL